MDDQIRSYKEYVYAKYVDGARIEDLDEDVISQALEAHFGMPEYANDPECVYVGILCFELGYEKPDEQVELFQRARYWLRRHRVLTGEEWDAVDDRLLDIDEFLAEKGIEVEEGPIPEQASASAVLVREIEDHGTMLLVPGGSFLFGEEQSSQTISPFYIDKYPVTNRQYEGFCRATGYRFPKCWSDARFSGPDAPVVGISVADAMKFCRWVGKQLPSEEQWEKACRGVDGRTYPWGEDDVTDERACHGRDCLEGSTDPVNVRPSGESPFGVFDMVGNCWEWTASTEVDTETVNIIKGGCYNDSPDLLRSHLRLEAVPKDKFETIGFRCIKSV